MSHQSTDAADAPRRARRGLLLAVSLSLALHAVAAGALATITWSGGGGPVDSPPIPIRIRLVPAAGGGKEGVASERGEMDVPRDADAPSAQPAPAEEIVVAPPDEPTGSARPEPEPQPDAAQWLLEVLADARDVASIPAQAPTARGPDVDTLPAGPGEWQGPPGPALSSAVAPRVARPPDIGLLGDGDPFSGGAGHGGGEGGGVGVSVGPGPGGREGGTGLLPVPLGDNLAPEYPLDARRAGEEGLVMIHARVLPDGSVSAAEVSESSGHARLDDAALQAVSHWRFQPALRDGQPIEQAVDVPIRFRLRPR